MTEGTLLAEISWLSGTGGAIILTLLAILTIRAIVKR
jgi:hypothetical protein